MFSCSAGPGTARGDARANEGDGEEGRRLYYVAMTRARKTLTLVSRRNDPVAYLREMGSARQHRRSVAVAKEGARVPPGRYETLGKRNLLIDFAGRKPEDNPAHRALAGLQAGDEVTLEPMDTEWPYSTGWTRRSDGCPCPRSLPGSSCGGSGSRTRTT